MTCAREHIPYSSMLVVLPLPLACLRVGVGGRAEIGNLASHLTNTCHLRRQARQQDGSASVQFQEEAAVKLLSELPQVTANLMCMQS